MTPHRAPPVVVTGTRQDRAHAARSDEELPGLQRVHVAQRVNLRERLDVLDARLIGPSDGLVRAGQRPHLLDLRRLALDL